MLVVRDVANEEEAQVLAQGDDVQEPAAEEVVPRVVPPTPTSPSSSSPVIPSLPPHQPPCLENDKATQQLEIVRLKARVKKLKKINKVKPSKLRRLKKEKDAEVEGRHADKQAEIYNIDLDHSLKVLSMQEDDTEVQEAVEIVTTTKLMTEVVTAAAMQVVAASTPIPAVKPKILSITAAPAVSTKRRKGVVIRDPKEELTSDTPAETPKVKDKGKGILIEAPKHMKKKDQIEMDTKYARKLHEEINKEHEETYKNIDWNAAIDHNTEGYKMDFFKGKKYDEILPIFQAKFDANMKFLFKSREEMEKEDEEIIKSINETPPQKAAKRRKLSEEAQEADDLRKRLEIVQDEDDDVFVEATPLAQKDLHKDPEETIITVTVQPKVQAKEKGKAILIEEPKTLKRKVQIDLDEEVTRQLEAKLNADINWNAAIEQVNRSKRLTDATLLQDIRDDGNHRLLLSFNTMLRNFDREDLESLWKIVKEIFEKTEPKNYSDDYLLNTLKIMFEKPNVEANVWKDQKGKYVLAKVKSWKLFDSCRVHCLTLSTTQIFLLIEIMYPLTHFTLEQMVNNVRLEVEDESEMSLELLRVV
nr:hypothetical protein [Tanacetum cinerariifolium]